MALPSLFGGWGGTARPNPHIGQLGSSLTSDIPTAPNSFFRGAQPNVPQAAPAAMPRQSPAARPSQIAARPTVVAPPVVAPPAYARPQSIVTQPPVPYVPSNAAPQVATPAPGPQMRDALAGAAAQQPPLNPFLSGMGFQAGNPEFNRRQSAMMQKQMRNWGGPQNLLAAMGVGNQAVLGMDHNQMQRQLGDRQTNVQRELGLGDQAVRRYISDNSLTGVRHTSDNALAGTRYTADIGLRGVQDTNAVQRERTSAEERTATGAQSTQRHGYDTQNQAATADRGLKERELAMREQEAAARREGAVPARDRAKFEFYSGQAETARTPAERQRYQQLAEQILSPGATGVQTPSGTAMEQLPFDVRQQVQQLLTSEAPPEQVRQAMIAGGMDRQQIEAVLGQAFPTSSFQPSIRNPGGTLGGELAPRNMWEALGSVGGALMPGMGPMALLPQARRMWNNAR